jgi:hypothetical protein
LVGLWIQAMRILELMQVGVALGRSETAVDQGAFALYSSIMAGVAKAWLVSGRGGWDAR